jgi:hypothetical protein
MISWLTVLWSMASAACFTLAGIHLVTWFQAVTAQQGSGK